MKPVATVKDSITFTLTKASLTEKNVGDFFSTPKRPIRCGKRFNWWIQWYPAGREEADNGNTSIFVCVDKDVKLKVMFNILGRSLDREFISPKHWWGWSKYGSHAQLCPLFRDGHLIFTCNIEVVMNLPFIPSPPRLFQSCDGDTDFELVLESETVRVHKHFLTLISPVFRAMLSHDTVESRSGKVIIADFDFETVKSAIDYCYGRELEGVSIDTSIGILRFADKYDIKDVTCQLEPLLSYELSIDNFCSVVQYAHGFSKDTLLNDCYFFYRNNEVKIKAKEEFSKLPLALVVLVLESAFDLKNDYEILRHAHKSGIDCIVDHLEQPLLESLAFNDFCLAVAYAWDCSRDNFKKACATFINNNENLILNHKPFFDLPSTTVFEVLKLKCALNNPDN